MSDEVKTELDPDDHRDWPRHGDIVQFETKSGQSYIGVYHMGRENFWVNGNMKDFSEANRNGDIPTGSMVFTHWAIKEWKPYEWTQMDRGPA